MNFPRAGVEFPLRKAREFSDAVRTWTLFSAFKCSLLLSLPWEGATGGIPSKSCYDCSKRFVMSQKFENWTCDDQQKRGKGTQFLKKGAEWTGISIRGAIWTLLLELAIAWGAIGWAIWVQHRSKDDKVGKSLSKPKSRKFVIYFKKAVGSPNFGSDDSK